MTILRRPGAALATLLILLIGIAFLTQVVPYRQIVESRHQVAAARTELAALQTENQQLEQDVAALQTEAEIEKLAREKLGYVRPGEIAYVVLDPPGSADSEVVETEPVIDEEPTWVESIWDFLTGADLDE
jgi:cell division protein FtsL